MRTSSLTLGLRTLLTSSVFLLVLLAPSTSHAATFSSGKSLTIASSTPDNAYLAGTVVTVTAPLPADLSALGGTVSVFAPIQGDAMLAGGTVDVEKPITGDARLAGAHVIVASDVGGDVVAAGGIVSVSGSAHDMLLAGGTVHAQGDVSGPVTIYAADVTLGGDITGDVSVVATDHFALAPGTHIHGKLKYNAPIQIDKSQTAVIDGGVTYTGSYSYVPTNAEAQQFAVAGAGVFFIVRALAVAIAAGLFAGLFPFFALRMRERVFMGTPRRQSLLPLLGLAILVTTPVLLILLTVSFVGIGLALILGSLFLLLVCLSYVYAGILLGACISMLVRKGSSMAVHISWQRAVIGSLAFFLLGLLPYLGSIITVFGTCTALGAIVAICYRFAFMNTLSPSSIEEL